MKKITFLLVVVLLFLTTGVINAQDASRECKIKYNLFKGDFSQKKYGDAYTNWIYLMDNCKKLTVNIYIYGAKLAEIRKDPALVKRVYEQRLKFFPNNKPAKVHSDYATYLMANKLASKDQVFSLLEKAYKISPQDMSIKNIYRYFQGVTDKYKDTNPQKVFDTYDDVVESVQAKLDYYSKKIVELTKDSTRVLGDREKARLRVYTINSKALGTVEGGLDAIISGIATCERLIPLYNKEFEANKTKVVWLKRAVSRMFNKGCQKDPLFEKLARTYAEASPSPDAYSFLANILEDNGNIKGAAQMRKKAFSLESDPLKKAKYELKFAYVAKERGQLIKARNLAREAIRYNPHFGKAYLFIASLYSSSVNSCGKNEFEKRMVYVAAANKAQRAAFVDPSISSLASRYVRAYRAHEPSQKVIFTAGITPGSKYTIKCWIGETVRVPTK